MKFEIRGLNRCIEQQTGTKVKLIELRLYTTETLIKETTQDIKIMINFVALQYRHLEENYNPIQKKN